MKQREILSHEDLIWLAGLIEGEGCLDLHRGKYPRIRVGMTDRDVVGRVASLLGTSIRMTLSTSGHRATFHAEISGRRAASIMRELLPYMGARRSAKIGHILGLYAGRSTTVESLPGPSLTRPPGFAPHLIEA